MTVKRILFVLVMASTMPGILACSSTGERSTFEAKTAEEFIQEVIAKTGTHADEPAMLRMVPGGFTRDASRSTWFFGEMTAEPFVLADGTRVQDLVVYTRSDIPVTARATLVTPQCLKHGHVRRITGAQRGPMVMDGDGRDNSAVVRVGIFVEGIRGRDGCVTEIAETMQ